MITIPVERVGEGTKHPYTKVHDDGKIIEKKRIIYLREDSVELARDRIVIEDITEIRIGSRTLRFLTKRGRYVIVPEWEVLYMDVRLAEDGLQL